MDDELRSSWIVEFGEDPVRYGDPAATEAGAHAWARGNLPTGTRYRLVLVRYTARDPEDSTDYFVVE